MTTAHEPMPPAPAGYVACRVIGIASLTTHLVALDENGSNGGRPTVCGLTRFDRFENNRRIPNTADLPGWGMGNSGVTGPGVRQIKCARCYQLADPPLPALAAAQIRLLITDLDNARADGTVLTYGYVQHRLRAILDTPTDTEQDAS